MIIFNVYYQLEPGCREEYISAVNAAGILESARQEAGCLKYDFYLPLDRPDELLLVEHYADEDALAVHKASAHYAHLQEIKKGFVRSARLDRLCEA